MLTTLLTAVVALQGGLTCPVAGDASTENSKFAMDYAGNRYAICCGGCVKPFTANPAKFAVEKEGKLFSFSLFDPVSGEAINLKERGKLGSAEFASVRYYFNSESNLSAFKADPKAFTKTPEKEALYCAVMQHGLESYADAGGYADFEGVRYYSCCPDCLKKFKADPAQYAGNAKAAVRAPKATKAPK